MRLKESERVYFIGELHQKEKKFNEKLTMFIFL
jgi:hypothetical protein